MTNLQRNVYAASDLVANACRLPASLRRFPFGMAKIHPCEERAPQDTGRRTLRSQMIRSGYRHLWEVSSGWLAFFLASVLTVAVSFKDETDQTAAEYHVVPVGSQQSVSRSSSEGLSTPSSTPLESSQPAPDLTIPSYASGSQVGSRSTSANSPRSSTPVRHPRITNVNEAYLLRHFQKYLAPWVSCCFNFCRPGMY